MTSKSQHRFNALTGLRAVAAIMVFLYHNRKPWIGYLPDPVIRLLNEFHCGVSVFFVLSGFLIAYTYAEKPAEGAKAYSDYILVRLVRIFPVYLLLISVKYIDLGFPSASETAVTYTLTQGLFSDYSLSGIPQAWSLTTELCFYLLAPFIVLMANRNGYRAFLFLLALLALTLLLGWGLHAAGQNKHGFLYDPAFVFNTVFSGRFFEFFCGIGLALLLKGRWHHSFTESLRYKTLWGVLGLFLTIAGIACFQGSIWTHGIDKWGGIILRNCLLPLATALLIFGLIQERTWLQWLLGNRVAVLLGNASFIFYLVHINYVNTRLWKWHIFPDRNFTLLWIVSITIYLLVEKPVYEGLKKLIRGKKASSVSGVA